MRNDFSCKRVFFLNDVFLIFDSEEDWGFDDSRVVDD